MSADAEPGATFPPRDISLRAPDEAELHLIVGLAVHGAGRRTAHAGDRALARGLAAQVIRAMRQSKYVILERPPESP